MTAALVGNVLAIEASPALLRALELVTVEFRADGLSVPVDVSVAAAVVRETLQRRRVAAMERVVTGAVPSGSVRRILNVKQAAVVLGVGEAAVRKRARARTLDGWQVGRVWQFDAATIEKDAA